MRKKALFIGFDDVLITTKSGKRFPIHSEDWELNEYVIEAIKYYLSKGFMSFIVTNQDRVRDGFELESVFLYKITSVCEKIEEIINTGINKSFMGFHYCIEDGDRRIPNNGMIIEIIQDFNISLKESIAIGGNEFDADFSNSCFIGKYIDCNDLPKLDFRI